MKKILAASMLALAVFMVSCDGTKKTSENQTTTGNETKKDETAPIPPTDQPGGQPAENQERKGQGMNVENLTGEQIVENATNRLVTKLNLTDQQTMTIRGFLKDAFTKSGRDFNKVYSVEEARTIGKEITQSAKESIIVVLDKNQKEQFQNMGQRH
jgi:hypothetical protein